LTDWDRRWLKRAADNAEFSKDRSTKVGAVLVGDDQIPIAEGWNGFPRGCDDEDEELHIRPTKYMWTIHAEMNVICNAARTGRKVAGSTLYSTLMPCAACALHITQCGVKRVVVPPLDVSDPGVQERWQKSFNDAMSIFNRMHVVVEFKI